jgi:hypothetical protein
MAKKAAPKKIEKNESFLNKFKKDRGIGEKKVKDKEMSWIPFNKAFYEATGCPGVPRGFASQFRGFSDTGKSTGIYETVAGAQKLGEFVVIIDTEGSWNWSHAKNVGVQFTEKVDEETGEVIDYVNYDEVTGEEVLLFAAGKDLLDMYRFWDYKEGKEKTKSQRNIPVIEDVARLINEVFDAQDEGQIDRPVTVVWDSIGSISCYAGALSNTNNNMWNAGALNREFESILNFRIPASRREEAEGEVNHWKTLVTVQKIWLDSSGMGQPIIKHKGGEGFRYGVKLVFHLGGKTTSSSKALKATTSGQDYQFGTQTKIEVFKNHLDVITKKGEIVSTAHGYIGPNDIDTYKKEHRQFILDKLGGDFDDFDVTESPIDDSSE